MGSDITDKLVGEDVVVCSKSRLEEGEKMYEGRIISYTPGKEVVLGTGLKAHIPVKIPFAGIWEGIFLIYGKNKGEDKGEGASHFTQLYDNPRVLELYKFNPWGDSILEDQVAREIIASYGQLG